MTCKTQVPHNGFEFVFCLLLLLFCLFVRLFCFVVFFFCLFVFCFFFVCLFLSLAIVFILTHIIIFFINYGYCFNCRQVVSLVLNHAYYISLLFEMYSVISKCFQRMIHMSHLKPDCMWLLFKLHLRALCPSVFSSIALSISQSLGLDFVNINVYA